jgi:hypothetical protein
LEGIATVLFGALSYFLLPRNIESAYYLSPAQKEALQDAHKIDAAGEGHGSGGFRWSEAATALWTPHVWLVFICLFGNGVTLYGLAYFAPSIVGGLGYGRIDTQLYSVPVRVLASRDIADARTAIRLLGHFFHLLGLCCRSVPRSGRLRGCRFHCRINRLLCLLRRRQPARQIRCSVPSNKYIPVQSICGA